MIPTLRQMATDELRASVSALRLARRYDRVAILYETDGFQSERLNRWEQAAGSGDCRGAAARHRRTAAGAWLRRDALMAAQSETAAAYAKGRADEREEVLSRWYHYNTDKNCADDMRVTMFRDWLEGEEPSR